MTVCCVACDSNSLSSANKVHPSLGFVLKKLLGSLNGPRRVMEIGFIAFMDRDLYASLSIL